MNLSPQGLLDSLNVFPASAPPLLYSAPFLLHQLIEMGVQPRSAAGGGEAAALMRFNLKPAGNLLSKIQTNSFRAAWGRAREMSQDASWKRQQLLWRNVSGVCMMVGFSANDWMKVRLLQTVCQHWMSYNAAFQSKEFIIWTFVGISSWIKWGCLAGCLENHSGLLQISNCLNAFESLDQKVNVAVQVLPVLANGFGSITPLFIISSLLSIARWDVL